MPELFAILQDFKDELSLKLIGSMGFFGGGTAIVEEENNNTSGESTAEEVDAFFNDF